MLRSKVDTDYTLKPFGSKDPRLLYKPEKRMNTRVYSAVMWTFTAWVLFYAGFSLIVLTGRFRLRGSLRDVMMLLQFVGTIVLSVMYTCAVTVFWVRYKFISHRYITEIASVFVASVLAAMFAAVMGMIVRESFGGIESYDDDNNFPVVKLEARISEGAYLALNVVVGIVVPALTLKAWVCNLYPEKSDHADQVSKRISRDYVDMVDARREIARLRPDAVYLDPEVRFWNGYNILNMAMVGFADMVSIIALLVLFRVIELDEDLRHTLAAIYAVFGIVLIVIFVPLALQFYHKHQNLTHRFKVETRNTLLGTFVFFAVSFAMLLVVDNQYGRNEIVADDDMVDDIFFDDGDVWNLSKQEGKGIEALVFLFQIILAIYANFWGVRAVVSHAFVEVVSQAYDYIQMRTAKIFGQTHAPVRKINVAPVGLGSLGVTTKS